ncbi:MAG: hypothetical protein AB7D06_01320 [Pedobacter sp.]|jgi:hypothetical protein
MNDQQTEQQRIEAVLQLSPEGANLLEILQQEELPDEASQKLWRNFDAQFQQTCIKEANGGLALDEEAFAAFIEDGQEPLIQQGVGIYNGCVKALSARESHDCRVYKCLTQIYLAAKMALKYRD